MASSTSIFCKKIELNTPFTSEVKFKPILFPDWQNQITQPSYIPIVSSDLNSVSLPYLFTEELEEGDLMEEAEPLNI